jgi:AbrB family looped-hinge helix DNA binding protein
MPSFRPTIYGTTTMNEKGQVVIPAEARAELQLEPGTRLMIMKAPFGQAVMVVKTEVIESHMQSWSAALATPDAEASHA